MSPATPGAVAPAALARTPKTTSNSGGDCRPSEHHLPPVEWGKASRSPSYHGRGESTPTGEIIRGRRPRAWRPLGPAGSAGRIAGAAGQRGGRSGSREPASRDRDARRSSESDRRSQSVWVLASRRPRAKALSWASRPQSPTRWINSARRRRTLLPRRDLSSIWQRRFLAGASDARGSQSTFGGPTRSGNASVCA